MFVAAAVVVLAVVVVVVVVVAVEVIVVVKVEVVVLGLQSLGFRLKLQIGSSFRPKGFPVNKAGEREPPFCR